MKTRWPHVALLLGIGLPAGAGCTTCCSSPRACLLPPERCAACGPTAGYLPPSPLTPAAAPIMTAPPRAALAPPQQIQAYAPLPPAPEHAGHAPTQNPVTLAPLPPAPATGSDGIHLYPPEASAPSTAEPPRAAVSEDRSPSLPVGIPQFAQVKDRVSSGLKPLVDGGLDWLQAHRYRAVLHVRAPGADDSADRQQVEKHGMRYLSLELSPQTLSPNVVSAFMAAVDNPDNQPLFVYDRDGSLAGALWYLYFRTAEKAGDEAARARAARLGLRPENTEMWLAISRYLSAHAPAR